MDTVFARLYGELKNLIELIKILIYLGLVIEVRHPTRLPVW